MDLLLDPVTEKIHEVGCSRFVLGLITLILGSALHAGPAEEAQQILATSGVKGGLVVHVGAGDGKLTLALGAGDAYLVHGLENDPAGLARARENAVALGICGKVGFARWDGRHLPYVDNTVNLLVAEAPVAVADPELQRVLAPGGAACVRRNGQWTRTTKPRPDTIDEWTHYLYDASNNAVSKDATVGPPRRLQWVGSPRWSRHHDHMSSVSAVVSAGGRVFYVMDEATRSSILLAPKWQLIARDAFNGVMLWKRSIPVWHNHLHRLKSGPAFLPRRLVADANTVYATLGISAPLTALDAATGKTLRTYEPDRSARDVILSEGVLFLVLAGNPDKGDGRSGQELVAIRADRGDVLWRKKASVLRMTLAADDRHTVYHDGERIVCLDRGNGEQRWQSDPVPRAKKFSSEYAPTLVLYGDVVLFSGGEAGDNYSGKGKGSGKDTMTALSAKTGEVLWKAKHPPSGYRSPEDVLVAGGLVWTGETTSGGLKGVFTGRDPMTGEVKSTFPPDVKTYWFHHRCHRAKATEKYLLTSRTGVEFIDHEAKHWMIHHWVRGACLYGIMPANGLLYAPQHPCACYLEAKLNGFNALAPARSAPAQLPDTPRLEKGPAFGDRMIKDDGPPEWTTYRGDAARSGSTKTSVPTNGLARSWSKRIADGLTAVTVAGETLYLAAGTTHTVYAVDTANGAVRWAFTAGGRVDSPPSIVKGRVIFGSADGHVYALRATDGALAWRFRAAPADRRLVSFEQLESVWPVHGSVLVQDGAVWCTAGRSVFLDGGLRVCRLDPASGTLLSETVMDDKDPVLKENLQVNVQALNMPVGLPDIMSAGGQYVFMRSQAFDGKGNRLRVGAHWKNRAREPVPVPHLFCPTGFLDDSWWHRTYWLYGRTFTSGWNKYYLAGKQSPAGRILVFDESYVYGYGRKPQYYRWTTPIEYRLFRADKRSAARVRPTPTNRASGPNVAVAISKSLDPTGKALAIETWVKPAKPNGVILARGGHVCGYALFLRKGTPHFAIRAAEKLYTVAGTAALKNEWVHLAGVLSDDGRAELYVEGKRVGSGRAALIPSEPRQEMGLGADGGSEVGDYPKTYGFKGLIDDVRIYHGTVTPGEIRQHAETGQTAAENGTLVFHCTFDKGDATDLSGKGNHGTLNSVAVVDGKTGKGVRFGGQSPAATPAIATAGQAWARDIPVSVRAMLLADKVLFVAGPPDLLDESKSGRGISRNPALRKKAKAQAEAMAGKRGAVLWGISKDSGAKVLALTLDSPPVWDGMAAARGRLYLACMNGTVECYGGE